MRKSAPLFCALLLSLSARRAWIEMCIVSLNYKEVLSLSARRAWIEIMMYDTSPLMQCVALRKESVDRNVLLVNGGVLLSSSLSARRAWIEIHSAATLRLWACPSLSARRAWIEILISTRQVCLICVALRKESVDRNGLGFRHYCDDVSSLSARRAWIEIRITRKQWRVASSSLSARRAWIEMKVSLMLICG